MVRDLRLSTRLAVLLVALLLVAFTLVAAITAIALHTFLEHRLDQQLEAAGTRFSVSLEHPNDHDADNDEQFRSASAQAAGTLGARIDRTGQVTAAAVVGDDRKDRSIAPGSPARDALARLHAGSSPHTIHLPDLGEYRVLVVRGDDGDLLVTGLPTSGVDGTIARLVAIEAVVFAAVLVLTSAGAYLAVRAAVRPLRRMAATATHVADLPLSSGTVSLAPRSAVMGTRSEVGLMSTAFDHMLDHVESSLHQRERSEERLRRFIADASHELRTPVAVIRGHAEFVQRTGSGTDPETARSLERISAESDRIGRLVDDLLLLARLDSGRSLARDEVDVSRLVVDAVTDAQVAGPEHRWRLDVPEQPVTVTGDAHALHQVVANLLANARTHTPAGTTVTATVRPDEPGRAVEIDVADDGPGIPAAVRGEVFERFVRGDAARSPTSGSSGLGLSIVHAIVRAHGGDVTVSGEPGATRFRVRLPVSDAPVSAPGRT